MLGSQSRNIGPTLASRDFTKPVLVNATRVRTDRLEGSVASAAPGANFESAVRKPPSSQVRGLRRHLGGSLRGLTGEHLLPREYVPGSRRPVRFFESVAPVGVLDST